jgi:hypothetical protein
METLNPEPVFVNPKDYVDGDLICKGFFMRRGSDESPGKFHGQPFIQIRSEDDDSVCYQLRGHASLLRAFENQEIGRGRYVEVYSKGKGQKSDGTEFYKYKVCAEKLAEPSAVEAPKPEAEAEASPVEVDDPNLEI